MFRVNILNCAMHGTCILCKSKRYKLLHVINEYHIVKCENCGLVYTVPWPKQKDLEKFYKTFDFKMGFKYETLIRRDARRSLQNIKKLGFQKGSLLDIGCGAGFFLDEARKVGWNTRGVDTSRFLVNYARKNLHLDVVQQDIHPDFTAL